MVCCVDAAIFAADGIEVVEVCISLDEVLGVLFLFLKLKRNWPSFSPPFQ